MSILNNKEEIDTYYDNLREIGNATFARSILPRSLGGEDANAGEAVFLAAKKVRKEDVLTGFRWFHNALRILHNIDMHELVEAGIIGGTQDWYEFKNDPYRWFILADEAKAFNLYTIIDKRNKHYD